MINFVFKNKWITYQMNLYAGAVIGALTICAVYFKNIRSTSYLPINTWSQSLFLFIPVTFWNADEAFENELGVFDRYGYANYLSTPGLVSMTSFYFYVIRAPYNATMVLDKSNILDQVSFPRMTNGLLSEAIVWRCCIQARYESYSPPYMTASSIVW